jgi:hypothetical protein
MIKQLRIVVLIGLLGSVVSIKPMEVKPTQSGSSSFAKVCLMYTLQQAAQLLISSSPYFDAQVNPELYSAAGDLAIPFHPNGSKDAMQEYVQSMSANVDTGLAICSNGLEKITNWFRSKLQHS